MSYLLESSKLKLRPCSEADLDLLLNHWTKPQVRRYLFDDRIADQETIAGFILRSGTTFRELHFGLWVLIDKVDGDFRGVCGFTEKGGIPDLLFSIEPEYWGKGLATESSNCVSGYLFNTVGIQQIVATVDKPNTISIKVLERLGLRFQKEELIQGNPILFYALTAAEYEKNTLQKKPPNLRSTGVAPVSRPFAFKITGATRGIGC